MSESGSDDVALIGLHKLSRVDGEASVPELKVLISLREVSARGGNLINFPQDATRPPGDVPVAIFGRDAATGRNVVAFALPAGKSSGRFRRA